ncbi:MAG: SCO family protein [Pirellula sp.]|jgi:protein SCO1/2
MYNAILKLTRSAGLLLTAMAFVSASCFVGVASDGGIPDRRIGVGVEEKLDSNVPANVMFTDDQGRRVDLGKLLEHKKPIILTLNYSNCPGLCVAQLNGLVKGINSVKSLALGADFHMVSLSIDPRDTVKKAADTKARYSVDLEQPHSAAGWTFLTGSEKDIVTIAKAVGFNYTYDSKHDQYNHPAAAIFISPKGRITRYLYEVGFVGDTLKMALVEAGEGKIGSTLDAFVLWCSHYDANENRYSTSARTLLSVFAGIFLTMGLTALLPFWLSGRKGRMLERAKSSQTETISHASPV